MMFLAIAFLAVPTFAEEAEEEDIDIDVEDDVADEIFEEFEDFEEEEWDGTLAPSDDISASVIFPGHEGKSASVDDEVTVLIGLTNNGMDNLNVSYVGAHLHSPYDFDYYIQNFTVTSLSEPLPAAHQATIEYKFKVDARLEPLEYWLSTFVVVNGTRRIFKQTPVNGTFTITAAPNSWISDVVTYIISLAALAAIGYAVVLNLPKGKKAGAVVKKAKDSARDDSWDVPASAIKAGRRGKAKRA